MYDFIQEVNAVAWVLSNVVLAYSSVALLVFVAGYYILFDPSATTGGKFIFRFMISLVGVMALVFIGVFVDPVAGRAWFTYPGDVALWRPVTRLIIYSYIAFTITSLAVLLVVRKWHPHKLVTARDLVKPRDERD